MLMAPLGLHFSYITMVTQPHLIKSMNFKSSGEHADNRRRSTHRKREATENCGGFSEQSQRKSDHGEIVCVAWYKPHVSVGGLLGLGIVG